MHWLKSFLLLYKALLLFGFLTAFVSSCSPESNDRNPISLSLSISLNWRANVVAGNANPGINVILFNSGFRPDYNEIFLLKQPEPGVYDFRPFEHFYRTIVIEIPATILNSGANLMLQNSTNGDNQRFTIECDVCNIQTDAEDWMLYHKSCLIKNVKSNFCMDGADAVVNLTQVECERAHKWDFYGRLSPDATALNCSSNLDGSASTPTYLPSMTNTSDIQLSIGGIVGIVFGSAMATALIGLAIGFWFFRRHKQHNGGDQLKGNDRVNVQFYNDN